MKSNGSDQTVPASWKFKKWLQVSSNGVVTTRGRVMMTVMKTMMGASTAVSTAITPTAVVSH